VSQTVEALFMGKQFILNQFVKDNMHEMLFKNLKLTYISEKASKKAKTDFRKIEADSAGRWKIIIYHLLKI
jgi:hypothetical protein